MPSLKTFRRVAVVEALSFLALLVASFLKHSGEGEGGVTVLGPVHGALFVAYVWIAVMIREREGWSGRETLLILLGAVLPFGGFVVDRRLSD